MHRITEMGNIDGDTANDCSGSAMAISSKREVIAVGVTAYGPHLHQFQKMLFSKEKEKKRLHLRNFHSTIKYTNSSNPLSSHCSDYFTICTIASKGKLLKTCRYGNTTWSDTERCARDIAVLCDWPNEAIILPREQRLLCISAPRPTLRLGK